MQLARQDLDFDRVHGLRSIPVRYGVPAALAISRVMHVVTVLSLAALALVVPLGPVYVGGVLLVDVLERVLLRWHSSQSG